MKELAKNLLTLLVACVISGLLLEGTIRLLLPQNPEIRRGEKSFGDRELGVLRKPNQAAKSINFCYTNELVTYNAEGFRSDAYDGFGENGRVIILGDSYMEAVQVPDPLATGNLLKRILSKHVENFSIGGANTVKQIDILQRFGGLLSKADHVFLFFFAGNDIQDNSCEIKSGHAEANHIPFEGQCMRQTAIGKQMVGYRGPIGEFSEGHSKGWRSRLKAACQSCQLIYDTVARYVPLRSRRESFALQFRYSDAVFVDPANMNEKEMKRQWVEAWDITETLLLQLQNRISQAGARLTVVLVPSFLEQSLAWREDFRRYYGWAPPEEMTPDYPANRLTRFFARNNIDSVNLNEYFQRYIRANKMGFPYLSYRCDGHWSPLGHLVATEALIAHLKSHRICVQSAPFSSLNSHDPGALSEKIGDLTDLRSIVTEPGLAAIQNGRIYQGQYDRSALARYVESNRCISPR